MSCSDHDCAAPQTGNRYRRVLWAALGVGKQAGDDLDTGSVSLRADALDFLADAANYAVAPHRRGRALHWRARAALLNGGIMGLFGLWVAAGTLYHAVFATMPDAG